jgi:hypothetical protein
MSNLYTGPSIDASYQVWDHLAKQFQSSEEKIFLKIGQSETRIACGGQNQPIRNKNCLWRPYLLTDQDEMSNLYRGPSIDDSSWFGFIWQSGLREDF